MIFFLLFLNDCLSYYYSVAPRNPNKPNQDAFLMKHDPRSSSLIIACFDGHGDYGHDVSRFCKSYIEKELVAHPLFLSNLKGAILDVTHALGKNEDEEEEKII